MKINNSTGNIDASSGTDCTVIDASTDEITVLKLGSSGVLFNASSSPSAPASGWDDGETNTDHLLSLTMLDCALNTFKSASAPFNRANGWYVPSWSEVEDYASSTGYTNTDFLTSTYNTSPAPNIYLFHTTRTTSGQDYNHTGNFAIVKKFSVPVAVKGAVTVRVTKSHTVSLTGGDFCGSNTFVPTVENANCGNLRYKWSDNSGDESLTLSTSGNYAVTVTVTNYSLKEGDLIVQNGITAVVVTPPSPSGTGTAVPIGVGGIGRSW